MKIAILGTKGIPNNYGGYEQFAEFISKALVVKGHSVTVYNPSFHPFKEPTLDGVDIVRKYSPEKFLGGAANIIYDYLCLKDALNRDFDIIYEAGYHSVALAYRFLGVKGMKKPVIITNMDGLEYNRSKWNYITQRIIKRLERMAVEDSPYMISDNLGIKDYYLRYFGRESYFLPYGATPIGNFNIATLSKYQLRSNEFLILVARFEPENNIETILDGYVASSLEFPFIVVGKHENQFGSYLKRKFKSKDIRFVGGIYEKSELDALRHYSLAYFHGHSVGGTNPSLLEAMACGAFILAHDNEFNRHVLFDSAFYFQNAEDVRRIILQLDSLRQKHGPAFLAENRRRIEVDYNWTTIVDQHERLFQQLLLDKI